MERYRLLGIEHDGRESASARVVSREPNKWGVFPLHTFNSGDEVVLAADAQATIAALQAQLATCFKLSGADPDGNEDWRLAPHAVDEVTRLRNDYDELGDETEALRGQLTQRTAELERVRADNKALDEWRADVTVSLQRPGGAFFVDVPQHIKDLVKERDDLRTLLLALPKVEGQFEVGSGACYYVRALDGKSNPIICGLMTEQVVAYAILALLKHRQGME